MSETTRELILRHWHLANARQWDEFDTLLAPDLRYEVPQTREYIESGPGYSEMFRTWPGDWTATIHHLVCDDVKAVCIIAFDVGERHDDGHFGLRTARQPDRQGHGLLA
jgi:hypothetical protein